MPQMCLGCPDVCCTTQRMTRDVVPILANPFNWRVRWPRPVRIPLFSLGLKVLGVACGHSGRLLTHYRPREVRNSIYRYGQIHIDYRSKDSYRFISTISIIYGNTSFSYNSLWPEWYGWHFAGNIFKFNLLIMKSCIFCLISLRFFSKGPINNNNKLKLVQVMTCNRIGKKPLHEPMLSMLCVLILADMS